MVRGGHKSTQRARLLKGIVDVTNRGGYASASVSAVIVSAGVSRPTFYDYFADREACFLAAIADVQDQLNGLIEQAADSRAGTQAMSAAIEALITFARTKPSRARFLMSDALAGSPAALDARDEGIGETARLIERKHAELTLHDEVPDLNAAVLIGGVYRLLATPLRRGEPGVGRLQEDLLAWVESYARPSRQHRQRELQAGKPQSQSPDALNLPIEHMPEVLPPGRPRLSEEEVAENHRLRILSAAARAAQSKGYAATTIADITKLARVDGHVFYRLFTDKQDAFMAVHEFGLQRIVHATANAFFAGRTWPERIWEGARALMQMLDENPLLARVGFVEADAIGAAAVQRVEDSRIGFMLFLQEGLVYRPQPSPPSRAAMEAIITSIFEIVYRQTRAGEPVQLTAALPYVAHLCLTPFLGSSRADEFIDAQLKEWPSPPSRTAGVSGGHG